MNINELERRIRRVFSNEKVAVDTDDLWNNIESHLPESDNKKTPFKWSSKLGAFLILLVALWGAFIITKPTQSSLESTVINNTNEDTDDPVLKQSYSENEYSSEQSLKSENTSVSTSKNKGKDELFNLTDQRQNQENIITSKNNIPSYSNDFSLNTKTQNFKSKYESPSDFKLSVGKERVDHHNSFSNVLAPDIKSETIMKEEAQSTIWSRQSQSPKMSVATPLSLQSLDESESESYEYFDGNIWTRAIEELGFATNIDQSPSMAERHPFWIKKDRKWSISLGISAINRIGNINLINADWLEHFENRDNAESNLISFAIDAQVGYQILPNWRVHTGLIQSQYFKSSSASLSTVEDITVEDGLVQEIIGMSGTREIRGEVQGVRMTSTTVKRINKYSYLHIPIGISWMQSSNNLDFLIGLEGRFGIQNSYNGFLHPNSSTEYDLSTDTENWFNQSTPHFIVLNGGISYPISDVIGVGLTAQYYHQLGNVNTSTYGITENLSGIGLRTGIHFKL